VLVGCADTKEGTFSTMSTPEAKSMVSHGWIPSVLPGSATDVRLRWNIDSDMVRGTARVPAADRGALRAGLRPLGDGAAPRFWLKGSVTPPWWPADLSPPGKTAELRSRGWEVFVVPDRVTTFMALHSLDESVYFWSESS
jgi:hypothetical protein